ncbi:MAG: DNA repair protein RadC [Spirochaetales bacterium]|nr:DNA repair protein RadC [Spirochaetales bacterium]
MRYEAHTIDFRSIKEMPTEDRPRERMHSVGAQGLSDLELLCIILSSGSRVRPVQDLATEILELVDRKRTIGLAVEDLETIDGLGPAKAASICACLELGRRFTFGRQRSCRDPESIFDMVRHYGDRMQEHFIVVMLNGAHELIGLNVVSIGLVNRALAHPREVFADPIKERATAIVLAHNHPSGNLEPSTDDIEVTTRLRKAGALLGIEVLDHLIFSADGYRSMHENGEFF